MSSERQQRAARAEQMRKERDRADRRQRNFISIGIVLVVIVLIAIGGYAVSKASKDNADSSALIYPASSDRKTFGFDYTSQDAGGVAQASDAVVVTVTEDFQCPVCRTFEEQSGPFLEELVKKGEIVVNYRPISFLDRASRNEFSSRAANAAMCVLDEGGATAYKKFHDLVYANQPEENTLGPENSVLVDWAAEAGVDGADKCISAEAYGPWLKKAYDSAVDDGFSGTPWVRIDGKDVESPSPAALQAAIDAANNG